jgi:hypothetical protein
MDISSISAASSSVTIRNPSTSEPIGLTITLRHSSSAEVKQVQRRITNDILKIRGKLTAEKVEANRLDVLVAATEGWTWEGETTWHGEKPDATADNIRKIYKQAPWIKEQVDEALSDDAAFFRGTEGIAD